MAFGLGSQLFGEQPPVHESPGEGTAEVTETDKFSEDEEESDVEALADEMDNLLMESPELSDEWKSAPSYRPVYLSTVPEYIPPPPKIKQKVAVEDNLDDSKKSSDQDWGFEGWEKVANVDGAFERFTKRIESEPEQCVRLVCV